jgi:hypothetical protein
MEFVSFFRPHAKISTKVEEIGVAAHNESIMSNTISGPNPGPMVIFLTDTYMGSKRNEQPETKALFNPSKT